MGEDGREISRRDEILELLYWLEGEGLGRDATVDGLARFLSCSQQEVEAVLGALVRRGDIAVSAPSGEYRLTASGRPEAARRFADEFASMLRQGHGECNDPDCECHDDPAAAAECHKPRGCC